MERLRKFIPSQEFADALQEVGNSKNIKNGLDKVKDNFIELLKYLHKDPRKNGKLINHIVQSLADINNGESMGFKLSTQNH
jgi:hypothetical protein